MKSAKIIRDGGTQSVRLPAEFQFSGKEVLIKRMGLAVILLPKGKTWGQYIDSVAGVRPDAMKGRAQPKRQSRVSFK